MGWNGGGATNDPRESSASGSSLGLKKRPTSWCRRGLFACAALYFFFTVLVSVKWSLWRKTATGDASLFERIEARKLAVVVPTHAGDLADALVALSSWPDVCSAIALAHMQLVLYYSGNVGDGAWSDDVIPTVERTGGRCFERTRVVFADLDKEVKGRSSATTWDSCACITYAPGCGRDDLPRRVSRVWLSSLRIYV